MRSARAPDTTTNHLASFLPRGLISVNAVYTARAARKTDPAFRARHLSALSCADACLVRAYARCSSAPGDSLDSIVGETRLLARPNEIKIAPSPGNRFIALARPRYRAAALADNRTANAI